MNEETRGKVVSNPKTLAVHEVWYIFENTESKARTLELQLNIKNDERFSRRGVSAT